MRIEITEKGSDAFYREVVNITAQYRSILKNHRHKLKDYGSSGYSHPDDGFLGR